MSFYNAIFGVHPAAPLLIALLEIDPKTVPRIRDCFMYGEEIVIYTRTGGGNRPDYEEGNTALTKHPLYLRDEDDGYDSTYALFYFRVPEEAREVVLQRKESLGYSKLPAERWKETLEALKSGKMEPPPALKEMTEKIFGEFKK